MNQRLRNYEICVVLGINQRYSSSKNAVEMFSAYRQEVNVKKKYIIFNLFYLHFCGEPHVCIGNSSLGISGVVPWGGSARNVALLHTHHTSPTLH